MTTANTTISEAALATSLNELAHAFARELAMACRKMSVYGPQHPMGGKAVEKPFFALDDIFRFRNHVNVNLHGGFLYVLNIRLKPSLFTEEIQRYLHILETEAVLIERRVTMAELTTFIDRLVKRVDLSRHDNLLSTYLEKNHITSIEVNSEKAFRLFEVQKQYRGDVLTDFSVRHLVLTQLGDNLQTIADIGCHRQQALEERGIDFRQDIIDYLLPEKVMAFPPAEVIRTMKAMTDKLRAFPDNDEARTELLQACRTLSKLIDYHPKRVAITDELDRHLSDNRLAPETIRELSTEAGAIRIASCEKIDSLLQSLFDSTNSPLPTEEFCRAFQRLLKTGQQSKATEVMQRLLKLLTNPDGGIRQRGLQLLLSSITSLDMTTDIDVFEATASQVMTDVTAGQETYEYSEVIWQMLQKTCNQRRFKQMARLADSVARRRRYDGNVAVYDSVAVKKVLDNLNQEQSIRGLIDEMIRSDHETACCLRRILIAIGSEEVAVALSHIISHPLRQVRQHALRVLGELGKASQAVFARILADESMFEREDGRHELADNKWYVVRNSIFVLGTLKDTGGVPALRRRLNDSDVRVRREIVTALEKIGGEDACDLLLLMAADSVREIRERAVVAVGLIGTPSMAPQLADLARRRPAVAVRALNSLGKIGGEEARSFLIELLKNDDQLIAMTSGQASKEELRLAVIESLGKIGDAGSIEALKGFKSSLSATQKLFFKNSEVNKALTEILSRH